MTDTSLEISSEDMNPTEKALKLYERLNEKWANIGENVLGKEEGQAKEEKTTRFVLFNQITARRKKHHNQLNQGLKGENPENAQVFFWLAQAFEHNEGRPEKQNRTLQQWIEEYDPFTLETLQNTIKDRIDETSDPHLIKGLQLFLKKLEDGEFQQFQQLLKSIAQFNKKQALFSFPHLSTVLLALMEKTLFGSEAQLKEIYYSLLQKIVDSAQVIQTLQNSKLSHKGVYKDAESIKVEEFRESLQQPDQDECIGFMDFESIRAYLNNISIYLAECLTKEFREDAFKKCGSAGHVPSMINVLDYLFVGAKEKNIILEKEIETLISTEGLGEEEAKKEAKRQLNRLVREKVKVNKQEIQDNIKGEQELRKALKRFIEEYYASLHLFLYMLRRYQFLKSFIINLYKNPPDIPLEITDLIFITALLGNKQLKPSWELISLLLHAQAEQQKEDSLKKKEGQFESELSQISSEHTAKKKIISQLVLFLNELTPLEIDDMVRLLSQMFKQATPQAKAKEIEQRFGKTVVNSVEDPLIQAIISLPEDLGKITLTPDSGSSTGTFQPLDDLPAEEAGNIIVAVSQFVREQCIKIIGNTSVIDTDETHQEVVFDRIPKNCNAEEKALRRYLKPMELDENFAYTRMMASTQPALTPADQHRGHIIPLKYQNDLRKCFRIYFGELHDNQVRRVYIQNKEGNTVCDEIVALQIPKEYYQRFGFQKNELYSLVLGLINFDDNQQNAVLRLYMVVGDNRPHDRKQIEGFWLKSDGERKKVVMISITENFKQQLLALRVLSDELTRTCSQTAWNAEAVQKVIKASQMRQRQIEKGLKDQKK